MPSFPQQANFGAVPSAGRSAKLPIDTCCGGTSVRLRLILIALVAAAASIVARAEVPLSAFTNRPALTSPTLSPSGRYLAYGVSGADQKMSVSVVDLSAPSAPATGLNLPVYAEIEGLAWKGDDRLLVTIRYNVVEVLFQRGQPKPYVATVAMDRDGKNTIALLDDVRELRGAREVSDIVHMLPHDKDHVLIAARTRTWPRTSSMSSYYNLYKANVVTGDSSMVEKADRHTFLWLADRDGTPRARWDGRQNGPTRIMMRTPGGGWESVVRLGSRDFDELKIVGFTASPDIAIVADRRGGERYTLSEFHLASRAVGRLLLDHPAVDIGWPVGDVLRDDTGEMLGACFVDDVWYCRYFDAGLNSLQQKFEAKFADSAAVRMVSWSNDRKRIVVATSGPRNPGAYFMYDVAKDAVSTIGRRHPNLPQSELGETLAIKYPARDGTKIPGYLTMPPGKGDKNLPLIVMPHGGPETRDYATFDPWVQMFANRGYAVLQPNFRGSGGYGKRFTEAGFRQWGRLMQDDITDGVKALIKEGTVDTTRVCIVGASYGGYAALAGGAFTPDLYKCIVSFGGISDILKMMEHEEYRSQGDSYAYDYWRRWLGDPKADAEEMKAISPINHATKFKAPVLLLHGSDDEIVPSTQSWSMKDALRKANKVAESKVISNEGHSPIQQGSRLYILAEIERFVTAHLGK